MAELFELPPPMEMHWRAYSMALREVLSDTCTPTELDYALGALKPVYMLTAVPQKIAGGVTPEFLQSINVMVHSISARLMFELLQREIKIFRLSQQPQTEPPRAA